MRKSWGKGGNNNHTFNPQPRSSFYTGYHVPKETPEQKRRKLVDERKRARQAREGAAWTPNDVSKLDPTQVLTHLPAQTPRLTRICCPSLALLVLTGPELPLGTALVFTLLPPMPSGESL